MWRPLPTSEYSSCFIRHGRVGTQAAEVCGVYRADGGWTNNGDPLTTPRRWPRAFGAYPCCYAGLESSRAGAQ